MIDKPVFEWQPRGGELLVPIVVEYAKHVIKQIRRWQEVREFWQRYLNVFIQEATQSVVGTAGAISPYDKKAAASSVIPTFEKLVYACLGVKARVRPVEECPLDLSKNILLYGGAEPSFVAERIELSPNLPFGGGLKSKDGIKYNITSEDINRARRLRHEKGMEKSIVVSASDWVIVNRHTKRTLVEPVQEPDGTYSEDGAIITYCPSFYREGGYILHLNGAREIGTYLCNVVLQEPGYLNKLKEMLLEKRINPGMPFQVVLRLYLRPYKPGTLASPHILSDVVKFEDAAPVEW
jgi:hypothetical protein